MEQHMYHNTFIHFSAEEHPLPRSQSAPSLSMPSCGEEPVKLKAEAHLSNFLERVAQNFRWTARPPPRVPGSFAHPEACSRPCVHYRFGNCTKGSSCEFCHLEHPRPKMKLDKMQRQCYDKLNEPQVLSLLLPYLKHRADQQAIGADIAPIIELIEGRLQEASPLQQLGWRKAELLDRSLRRMNTSRLMELLVGHPKVDTSLADQLSLVFGRARSVIQMR
ncbi:hypothetical protein AK812_SmicGene19268 [Symbiodinium microadriaticum]|uniref:C3H1-type domain-containing protein n=1 Tax=Symbiodinium microadriaticum TaxID=2951 RepID=A0A1Q9DT09_SYMMI|nr:hypothetical protein AK812_SmicGene19268 [Symbiodinium microadriaticum]